MRNDRFWWGASLLGLGVGLGMCVADFAIRWMGWDGPQTVSMVGAFSAWISLFVWMPVHQKLYGKRSGRVAVRDRRSGP